MALITAKTISGATAQYAKTLMAVEGGTLKKEYLIRVLHKVAETSLEDGSKLFKELDEATKALKKVDEEIGRRSNRNITALFGRIKKNGLVLVQEQLDEIGDLSKAKFDDLVNLAKKPTKTETKTDVAETAQETAQKAAQETAQETASNPNNDISTIDTKAAITENIKAQRDAIIDSAAMLAKMPLEELTKEFGELVNALDVILKEPAKNRNKMATIMAHLAPLI